ncbi:Uncharacterised protein [Vibrio cholerae]|nr:Uncharacterised protein [Vibrio cholerae]
MLTVAMKHISLNMNMQGSNIRIFLAFMLGRNTVI